MAIKEVIEITNKIMSKWMGIGGIAPDSVVDKMHNARLDWIIQLTDCLEIWTDRGGDYLKVNCYLQELILVQLLKDG